MSHTTVPTVATWHSLKPSDHADLDLGEAAHTFKPTTIVLSVTSLCLSTLCPIYRTIHSSLPALLRVSLYLSWCITSWILLWAFVISRRLEVPKSTCDTHLLVAGNNRHSLIHWRKTLVQFSFTQLKSWILAADESQKVVRVKKRTNNATKEKRKLDDEI